MSESESISLRPTLSYQGFSLGRIWALATNTFTQLVRMKVFLFLAVFTLLIIGISFFLLRFNVEQELFLIKNTAWGGAMSIFANVIALAGTALLIPRDMEDRTLYTILSKPVPRYEYLIGKYLGVVMVLGITVLVMDLAASGVLYLRQSMILSGFNLETIENPEALAAATQEISNQGLTWKVHLATWSCFLQGCLLTAIALLLSTIASSTLFSILVGAAVFLIGLGQAGAREGMLNVDASWIERGLFAIMSLAFPDFSMFSLGDKALDERAPVPSWKEIGMMTSFCIGRIAMYLMVAWFFFTDKEF